MSTACPEDNPQCCYDWCRGHSSSLDTEHIDRNWDDPIVAIEDGDMVTCYASVDTADRREDEIYLFIQKSPTDDGAGLYLTSDQAADLIVRLARAIANRAAADLTAQQAAELISRLVGAIANRVQVAAEVEGSVR